VPAFANSREVGIGYDVAGRMTALDWSNDGAIDVTFVYGPLGNVIAVGGSGGIRTSSYDAQMRRVKLVGPAGQTRTWRYASGRAPLEEKFVNGSTTTTYETVYVAGAAVGQIATNNTQGPTLHLLFNDRMGVTRKTATPAGTITRRVVMDIWGSTNKAGGNDVVVDASVNPAPSLGWRYPGQYVDPGGIRNNGWRLFIPEIGQYTSPEPLHRISAGALYGPHAYSYAAARPLRWTDPSGLYTVDEEAWGGDQARIGALNAALALLRGNKSLDCYFQRVWGRNPIDDEGSITPNDFWNPNTLGRGYPWLGLIHIDPPNLDKHISRGETREIAARLAHEMVHASFGHFGHAAGALSNPYAAGNVVSFPQNYAQYDTCGTPRCEHANAGGRFCGVCK
jgi:RHS repeat-associated protein